MQHATRITEHSKQLKGHRIYSDGEAPFQQCQVVWDPAHDSKRHGQSPVADAREGQRSTTLMLLLHTHIYYIWATYGRVNAVLWYVQVCGVTHRFVATLCCAISHLRQALVGDRTCTIVFKARLYILGPRRGSGCEWVSSQERSSCEPKGVKSGYKLSGERSARRCKPGLYTI